MLWQLLEGRSTPCHPLTAVAQDPRPPALGTEGSCFGTWLPGAPGWPWLSGAGSQAEKLAQGLVPSLCSDLCLHTASAYLLGPEPGSVLGRLHSLSRAGATLVL